MVTPNDRLANSPGDQKQAHYCPEWDYLYIDNNCPEFDACLCFRPTEWEQKLIDKHREAVEVTKGLQEALEEMLNQYDAEVGSAVGWRKRLHDSAREALIAYDTWAEGGG